MFLAGGMLYVIKCYKYYCIHADEFQNANKRERDIITIAKKQAQMQAQMQAQRKHQEASASASEKQEAGASASANITYKVSAIFTSKHLVSEINASNNHERAHLWP
jgi:hypothetical protein